MTQWERRVRVGPGEARARSGVGPERLYEYEEAGRVLRLSWDPRETGTVLAVALGDWSEPPGTALTDEERERALVGAWKVAKKDSVRALLELVGGCYVARHWARTTGFLLDVHDDGRIEYMELGRTLELRYRRDPDHAYRAVVDPPTEPRWTYPAGASIAPPHWERICQRLRAAGSDDMWIGRNLSWRIDVPAPPTIP